MTGHINKNVKMEFCKDMICLRKKRKLSNYREMIHRGYNNQATTTTKYKCTRREKKIKTGAHFTFGQTMSFQLWTLWDTNDNSG